MTQSTKPILIVEDDQTLNRLMVDQLKRFGFQARGCRTLAEAQALLSSLDPLLALLDIRLPDSSDVEAVSHFNGLCPVIILTAFGSIDQAVRAVQAGAADYLIKPVSASRLELSIRRAIETANLKRKLEILETKSKSQSSAPMVGKSDGYLQVSRLIDLVAKADTTVLIQGESGVGKELVAERIHLESQRSDRQFMTIDCASLHENLFESELFGHERGAFTGAETRKEGLLEVADGGTVFLDEIGEISPTIQAKLLRVLETSRFRRLGGTRDISTNVRFITATNRNLAEWAAEGKFRSDLYYRLSPFVITVPPLRERRDDILELARYFLDSRSFMRKEAKTFHPSTEKALLSYSWPGNIRELRNVVERGLLMSGQSEFILPHQLSLPASDQPGSFFRMQFNHQPTLEELKAAYIAKMLELHSGNRAEAAKAMAISERTVYRMVSDGKPPN